MLWVGSQIYDPERPLDAVDNFVHDFETQFDGKRLPRPKLRTTHCHACLCAWEEGDDDEDGNDASMSMMIKESKHDKDGAMTIKMMQR